MKNQKGITLVALVITIIVMLILVGVTITLATGQGGIFDSAKNAVNETNKAKTDEETLQSGNINGKTLEQIANEPVATQE